MEAKRIIEAWNSRRYSSFIIDNDLEEWFCELVKSQHSNDLLEIPKKEFEFLRDVGFPKTYPILDMNFDVFMKEIENVYESRKEKIDNGVELPRLRYKLFNIMATDSIESCDFCMEQFTGHIYKLAYGSGAYFDRLPGSSGSTLLVKTEYPVLNAQNSFGPYFLNSSFSKMIMCMISIRDIYIEQIIINKDSRTAYRMMLKKIESIDKLAIYYPESVWPSFIDTIKYLT